MSDEPEEVETEITFTPEGAGTDYGDPSAARGDVALRAAMALERAKDPEARGLLIALSTRLCGAIPITTPTHLGKAVK